MNHIKLKSLINESHINPSPLKELFEADLAYLEQKLIEEGLWDTIKQKVGGALEKTGDKAKEALVKPLIKVILSKIQKDDPKGFAQLQQYSRDPKKLQQLINHPDIQKQKAKVEKELQSTQESLTEAEADDFLQEYIDAVLEEARVLRDDPRNVARRARYAKRKADRLAQQKTSPDKAEPKQPSGEKEEPSAGQNIKQGATQLGKGLAQGADNLGVKAIEKTGDFLKGAGNIAGAAMDSKMGQAAKGALGGLISKVYGWAKSHPKITASVGIGLLAAVLTAASIGSGGMVPLITSTLAAAGGGAVKGGLVGSAVGAGKEMYSQIKGGAKSFKDMDYGKVGKAALKTGGKGAAIGAAVAGGANVLGKAAAGISKMFGGGAAASPTASPSSRTARPPAAAAVQDTAQQATDVALAAKQAAAAEKAAKGLEWVTNQAERFSRGGGFNLDQLKDVLGSVGQGAGKSQTNLLVRTFLQGNLPKEELVKHFTKLAAAAP